MIEFAALLEATYKDLVNGQRDITSLYPPFHDRVKKVADRGGIRLQYTKPGIWKFKVHSGTGNNWYDVYLKWKNLDDNIRKLAGDKRYWNKDKTKPDVKKIAVEAMFTSDMETFCSCPSDLYSGFHYIRTKKHAKYTEPENRPPDRNNPSQHGMYCKHQQLVVNLLPNFATDMAGDLNTWYKKDVDAGKKGSNKPEVKAGPKKEEKPVDKKVTKQGPKKEEKPVDKSVKKPIKKEEK